MERRQQARTPVNINALLVGEKTVPKGCRVMNVSQNGMQLHCEADGRLLTFKDGDTVEVHLNVEHDGKQQKLTIPSWVRHVDTNSIDVEFRYPDPQLVDLIETYRVSGKHKLMASLGRVEQRAESGRGAAIAGKTAGKLPGQTEKHAPRQHHRPFYTMILATVFAVCVITGGYVYTASIDSRISSLETFSKQQSKALAEVQDRIFNASLQEGRYDSLNARMTAIVDAIISLEDRLVPGTTSKADSAPLQQLQSAGSSFTKQKPIGKITRTGGTGETDAKPTTIQQDSGSKPKSAAVKVAATPSIEPPPSDEDGRPAISSTEPPKPAIAKNTIGSGSQTQRTGSKPAASTDDGPWIINLMSSPDKTYLERFSKTSGADKHNAVTNSAMVKGKRYWRLQITGFESASAAMNHARIVKQELGIKDVWIHKQE